MLQAVEIRLRPELEDCVGRNTVVKIQAALGITVDSVRVAKVYTVVGLSRPLLEKAVQEAVLHDPVLQEASLSPLDSTADWILSVSFRPGVTDNEGRTARETLALIAGKEIADASVYAATQYHISGQLTWDQVAYIASNLLANDLIQRYEIKSGAEWRTSPGFPVQTAAVTGEANAHVEVIPFLTMSDEELLAFSRANTLALSLEELQAIQSHYSQPEIQKERQQAGLPVDPTDAEIEALAQTWSEHCKHKIFSSQISYINSENGRQEQIDSLYKTCIQKPTKMLRERMGKNDFCRSVFKDNAGVVAFSESHDVCIKVETHNSPSALDPYGGALTGIVGVNRDAMGTGLGGELVCNTDVFCFASPFHSEPLPPRLLHPRRVMEGVREGVEHGGNKSGVPTVNGSIVFDERFLGKPLVYCGTVGMIPTIINGKPGYEKKARVGDAIVMVGGRIGKDGIHGATFSSEALHESSPATAVQIGDPITQRKMYDCLIRARNLGLYSAITDNGAGGLSSSVGEMAEDTGGCVLDLSKAPLKYDGLYPWEILLSEAQERMTLAVPQEHVETFLALAKDMDVEASVLGTFTDSGYFHVVYGAKPVAYLPMDFLHNGVPQMQLQAHWERPGEYPLLGASLKDTADKPVTLDQAVTKAGVSPEDLLLRMLGRLNICSKEYLIRQYDHEVKGGSVVKPLVGVCQDGPADAAVVRPLLDETAGIVLSHGICPKFSDADTYWMMANAIDEAIRNAVAVGADPAHMAAVDNFCWCDPVESPGNPDGQYKLAQLVRANKALRDFCLGFGVPCVSGKDSMKNDYTGGGKKISIPPTVLYSILARIANVAHAVTSDFKQPGDHIYILGLTKPEFAGSEIASELGLHGGVVPQVDLLGAKSRYVTLHQAMREQLVSACHDLSDGGLGVALAEMALGGRLGAVVDLDSIPCVDVYSEYEKLYSESASRLLVTVPEKAQQAFETLFSSSLNVDAALIGMVTEGPNMHCLRSGEIWLELEPQKMADAFKGTLNW